MFRTNDDSSLFSSNDYDLSAMLKIIQAERVRHKEILESVKDDLDQLSVVYDFLQTIKDCESVMDQYNDIENVQINLDTLRDIYAKLDCETSYLIKHTSFNEYEHDTRIDKHQSFLIHCIFDSIFSYMCERYDLHADTVKQILFYMLDQR